jgi:hypothetical protein
MPFLWQFLQQGKMSLVKYTNTTDRSKRIGIFQPLVGHGNYCMANNNKPKDFPKISIMKMLLHRLALY